MTPADRQAEERRRALLDRLAVIDLERWAIFYELQELTGGKSPKRKKK